MKNSRNQIKLLSVLAIINLVLLFATSMNLHKITQYNEQFVASYTEVTGYDEFKEDANDFIDNLCGDTSDTTDDSLTKLTAELEAFGDDSTLTPLLDDKYLEKDKELLEKVEPVIQPDEQADEERPVIVVTIPEKSSTTHTQENHIPIETAENEQPSLPEPDNIIVYNDISVKSGLSADEFDELINAMVDKYGKTNSVFIGAGKYLYQMEQDYNVNGVVALAISSFECGYGCSDLAVYKNNIFSINSSNGYIAFDSVEQAIDHFGNLIRTKYIDKGFDSLSTVKTKYCPYNSDLWESNIAWMISMYENL